MEYLRGKLIAVGGTADIYDIGNEKVYKCFHEDKSDGYIENEIECTSSEVAVRMGAPKIYEKINDGKNRGFVMEYVKGRTMLEMMLSEGEKFDIQKNAEKLAQIQCAISSFNGERFPKGHEVMRKRIMAVRCLDEKQKEKLLQLLEKLPQGNSVCHTDIHPGNIIVDGEQFRVIDWCDTMCDSPWMDVARTLLIFESVNEIPGIQMNDLVRFRSAWKRYYRAAYEQLAGKSEEELKGWMAVLAAVKMEGEEPINHPWMKKLIKDAVAEEDHK